MGCRKPGPLCGSNSKEFPDPGTSTLAKNPPPGTVDDRVRDFLDEAVEYTKETPKWVTWLVLSALQLAGVKSDAPSTIRFFKHYLSEEGEDLDLDPVPPLWQDEIGKRYKGRSGKLKVNPYNWGVFDIQNTLGHFDLMITREKDGSTSYEIEDYYQFPYKDDAGKIIRHGFEVDAEQAQTLRSRLPTRVYKYDQKFEIVKLGKKTYFYLPTEWLQQNGTAFKVKGKFNDYDTIINAYSGRFGTFDELGLAKALFAKGTNQQLVDGIFQRLERDYGSDSDDVARHYLRLMVDGGRTDQLKRMKALVSRLINILDSGMVSTEDQKWIDFLRKL